MAIANATDKLTIKISKDDMIQYTGEVYKDFADPVLNGINVHDANQGAHNLTLRFNQVWDAIGELADAVGLKLDGTDLSGKADVAGDTFTGQVVFKDNPVVVDGANATERSFQSHTNGSLRWSFQLANNDAETGGNSGSNISIGRHNDAGQWIDTPLFINRKTGEVTINNLRVTGPGTFTGEGLDIRLQVDEPTENLHIGTVWLNPEGAGGPPVDEGPVPVDLHWSIDSISNGQASESSGGQSMNLTGSTPTPVTGLAPGSSGGQHMNYWSWLSVDVPVEPGDDGWVTADFWIGNLSGSTAGGRSFATFTLDPDIRFDLFWGTTDPTWGGTLPAGLHLSGLYYDPIAGTNKNIFPTPLHKASWPTIMHIQIGYHSGVGVEVVMNGSVWGTASGVPELLPTGNAFLSLGPPSSGSGAPQHSCDIDDVSIYNHEPVVPVPGE